MINEKEAKLHDEFLAGCEAYLEHEGYYLTGRTYHDGLFPDDIKVKLSHTFTPTALHLRSRVDRIAIHRSSESMFYLECKIIPEGRENLVIEALPFIDYARLGLRGVKTLYACKDMNTDREFGFWADDRPIIDCCMIPPQRKSGLLEWYETYLLRVAQFIKVIRIDRTRGSNDPFFKIAAENVAYLCDWKDLEKLERIKHEQDTCG
jgi:hypothetical protein